jgi:hypothetical protein
MGVMVVVVSVMMVVVVVVGVVKMTRIHHPLVSFAFPSHHDLSSPSPTAPSIAADIRSCSLTSASAIRAAFHAARPHELVARTQLVPHVHVVLASLTLTLGSDLEAGKVKVGARRRVLKVGLLVVVEEL